MLRLKYNYVFLFILAFYCLVLTQFGFENFDTGYIPSFSWRILNGQSVYEDFIYKGPPVTLYFHAFFLKILPQTGQFLIIRIIAYLLFALQVFCVVSGFDNLYDLRKNGFDKWGMMCVGFIISLLNSSPFPWPTTDGLLFASIAFWLVSKYKNPRFFTLLIVALFSVLSALTKQSFYLVPLFFVFWIFVRYHWKKALVFSFQVLGFLAIYFCFIASITNFRNYLRQTTGQTKLHDLFYTGFHNYVFISLFWVALALMILAIAALLFLRISKQSWPALLPFLKWLSVAIFTIALIFCICGQFRIASRIAFDATVLAVVYAFFKKQDIVFIAPCLVALGIAWSASISFGYNYPVFFATGILLAFVISMNNKLCINSKYYFWIALPFCLMAFLHNLKPYREDNIFTLNYDMEAVSPKLKFIKTNKDRFEKYLELKKLISQYGKNYIVAPSSPMAHYLFNTQSRLPADWIIESEVDGQQQRFMKLAADDSNYVFLEKSFLNHEEFVPAKLEDFSTVAVFIHQKFNRIAETKYFIVYHSLKENEPLP